jgi:nucleoside-diphosphate-sugar epimerase
MNLVIGNTSQLAYYFPDDYKKISSRDIDFDDFENKKYESVYVCFAEQRTHMKDNLELFLDVNVKYTLNVVDFFSKISNRVIVYGTSELWNKYSGGIDITLPFDYNFTPYIDSKRIMINELKSRNYKNVIIIHPYNFNSSRRKEGFLFGKIFNSILNNKKIHIGNTYFYRELIHPKYVVERSILATSDEIIGSGRLIFINDFIRELYAAFNLSYDKLVTENDLYNLDIKRNINYLNSFKPLYNSLLKDTVEDLKNNKNV